MRRGGARGRPGHPVGRQNWSTAGRKKICCAARAHSPSMRSGLKPLAGRSCLLSSLWNWMRLFIQLTYERNEHRSERHHSGCTTTLRTTCWPSAASAASAARQAGGTGGRCGAGRPPPRSCCGTPAAGCPRSATPQRGARPSGPPCAARPRTAPSAPRPRRAGSPAARSPVSPRAARW